MKRYSKNDKPYIYVGFPKNLETQVLPVLESVAADGAQFWYSDRFDSWEKRRLQRAFGVLLFVTAEYSASERFRTIVDTAIAFGQNILCVYLEEIPSSPWSDMQLGSLYALRTTTLDDDFSKELKQAHIFHDMAVTDAQKKFQRNRAVTMVAAPILAAIVLFFTVVNPLLIAPASAINEQAKHWGMTRSDLENITELYIVGDQVYTESVHAWYDDARRTQIGFELGAGESALPQGSIPVGTLTSDDLMILEYMPNLEALCICGNQITDITPLLGLEKLRHLDLSANPICSIEGIGALTNLEEVELSYTDITDPSPLWDCTKLRTVMLDRTYISDLSGIEQLSELESLFINQTYVQDVSTLNNSANLRFFFAQDTPIYNIPTFTQTNDIDLGLNMTRIKDYSSLVNIQSYQRIMHDGNIFHNMLPYIEAKPIHELILTEAPITSLEALNGIIIESGGKLSLARSNISSLDGLENFEGLHELDLSFCYNLTDLTATLELQSLKKLILTSDYRQQVEEQLQGAHFTIEYCNE